MIKIKTRKIMLILQKKCHIWYDKVVFCMGGLIGMADYYYYRKNENINLDVIIPKENYYSDTEQSFENFNIMLETLQKKDVVYLEEIDVLGDINDIINRWKMLVEEMQVDIVICDYPVIDTRKLDYTLPEYVIKIIEYVNEKDKSYKQMRKRVQAQGIEKAKQAGVQFGRPHKMKQQEFEEQYIKLYMHGVSDSVIREILGLSKTTFWRYKSRMHENRKNNTENEPLD